MSQIDGNSVKSNEKSTKNVCCRYLPWMTTHTTPTVFMLESNHPSLPLYHQIPNVHVKAFVRFLSICLY